MLQRFYTELEKAAEIEPTELEPIKNARVRNYVF